MPQVNFLPWAGITTPINIGPVTITPWATVRTTIPSNARKFLDRYFNRYRTSSNQAVTDISIASIAPNPLQDLTATEHTTIRRAIDAFAFTTIAPTVRRQIATATATGIPNSERFDLITQHLTTYTNPITVVTRGMNHIWSIGKISFTEPWEAGGNTNEHDEEVLLGLGKLLSRKRNAHLRDRIFRTIEWFRLSNTGNPSTSNETRLVMKTTAFEVLLEPGREKRRDMTAALNALTTHKHARERTITISNKQYKVTEAAAWLDRAYKVRNAIIHGDTIQAKQFSYRSSNHLDVADAVLYEAVIWALIHRRLVGASTRRAARAWTRALGGGTPSTDLITTMLTSHFQLTEHHRALGWWKK
jgi:hypothetical protein